MVVRGVPQVILPCDYWKLQQQGKGVEGSFIFDDDIAHELRNLPNTCSVFILMDCCFRLAKKHASCT